MIVSIWREGPNRMCGYRPGKLGAGLSVEERNDVCYTFITIQWIMFLHLSDKFNVLKII